MEGQSFAVTASIFIWCISYLVSLYSVSYKFSEGLIPTFFREKTSNRILIKFLVWSTLLSPILAAYMYRIGAHRERGNGIAWGCYVEYFWIIGVLLWLLSLIILSMLLIILLIKPNLLRFQRRKNLLLAYFIQNGYSLIMLILIGSLIPVLAGAMSGKESSCW